MLSGSLSRRRWKPSVHNLQNSPSFILPDRSIQAQTQRPGTSVTNRPTYLVWQPHNPPPRRLAC